MRAVGRSRSQAARPATRRNNVLTEAVRARGSPASKNDIFLTKFRRLCHRAFVRRTAAFCVFRADTSFRKIFIYDGRIIARSSLDAKMKCEFYFDF